MKEIGSLLFLYTETPLHAGSGVALGAVDLPIQRERMTNLPMVQGSGIKGALRQMFREHRNGIEDGDNFTLQLFGPEPTERGGKDEKSDAGEGKAKNNEDGANKERDEFAGALSMQDARLLLLPVRTVWGGFAWVTSPLILERLARDLEVVKAAKPEWHAKLVAEKHMVDDTALVSQKLKSTVVEQGRLLLEDLEYSAQPRDWVDAVAQWLTEQAFPTSDEYKPFRDRLAGQLVILSDAEMKFWSEHATEVVARIRIDSEKGTVKDGALWSEESLPAESLLWSLAFFSDGKRKRTERKYEAHEFASTFGTQLGTLGRIRIGGDRTVGRGIVGVRHSNGRVS